MLKDLDRFLAAQERDYEIALSEIRSGKKKSHWMWYIFPQIKGLGHSSISEFYAIENLEEAKEFLKHPVLGERIRMISRELLLTGKSDAGSIFGYPDDLKLRSSMTLFSIADGRNENVFQKVLDRFFDGKKDEMTLEILGM